MNLEQSRQLAQNETTQPKTLAELAKHEDSLVREYVACNPNAPVEVLEKLGEEFPDAIVTNPVFDLLLLENIESKFILLSLARASTTSVEILKELADRQDNNIREAVVINRKTPISLINKIFAEDREREIKESVAKHPKTSKELLYNLAKENSFYICRAIANRENIPEEVIEILIQSGSWNVSSLYFEKYDLFRPSREPDSWHVRDLIASHLNVSKNVIDRLIEDEHHHVRAAIAAREDISEKQAMMLAGDLSDLVRKKLADNPKVSNAVKKLSNIYSTRNPNISVREKIARSSKISQETIEELARDSVSLIRIAIAENPQTPQNILDELERDRNFSVRRAIALRQDISEKVGRELAYNLAENVRQKLAKNTSISPEVVRLTRKVARFYGTGINAINVRYLYKKSNRILKFNSRIIKLQAAIAAQNNSYYIKRLLASIPNASNEIIQQLSKDANSSVRIRVAQNINTPSQILEIFATDESYLVRQCVANHPQTKLKTLNILKTDNNINVREKVAANSNISIEIIQELAQDSMAVVRQAIVNNPQTTTAILNDLKSDRSDCVRGAIAIREDISEEQAMTLALDLSDLVRKKLADNPNVSTFVQQFLYSSNKSIKSFTHTEEFKKMQLVQKEIDDLPIDAISEQNIRKNAVRYRHFLRLKLSTVPNISTSVVEKIIDNSESYFLLGLANNINTLPEVLAILSKNESYLVRQCVANHPKTKLKTLNILKTDNNINVREKVAANSNISIEIIQELAQDSMAVVRQAIVNNPQTTTAILNDLKRDRSDCVRGAIAIREDISEEIAVALADDTSAYVRQRLVCNPNVPVKIIELLSKDIDSISTDGNSLVQIEMIKNINLSPKLFENLAISSAAKVRQEVARHPQAPLSVLDRLKTDKDKYVRVEVAKNPNISLVIMEYLAKDSINSKPTSCGWKLHSYRVWTDYHHQVRLAIAGRKDITEKVASILSKDSLPQVRWTVANNVKVPLNIIRFLSKDSNQKVQDEAIKMLMNRQKAENIDEL